MTTTQPEQRQNALASILKRLPKELAIYGTTLGILALTAPSVGVAGVLSGITTNIISNLIDDTVRGRSIPDDELIHKIRQEIQANNLERKIWDEAAEEALFQLAGTMPVLLTLLVKDIFPHFERLKDVATSRDVRQVEQKFDEWSMRLMRQQASYDWPSRGISFTSPPGIERVIEMLMHHDNEVRTQAVEAFGKLIPAKQREIAYQIVSKSHFVDVMNAMVEVLIRENMDRELRSLVDTRVLNIRDLRDDLGQSVTELQREHDRVKRREKIFEGLQILLIVGLVFAVVSAGFLIALNWLGTQFNDFVINLATSLGISPNAIGWFCCISCIVLVIIAIVYAASEADYKAK